MATIVRCDKCKKELDRLNPFRKILKVTVAKYNQELDYSNYIQVALCDTCFERFLVLLERLFLNDWYSFS